MPQQDRSPRTPQARWLRQPALYLGAVTAAALVFLSRPTHLETHADVAPRWNVDVSSAGRRPVTALVFGGEAGVRLVRVPGAHASADVRRRIPVRLDAGNVYLVSLGWSSLQVNTASPPGSAPMAFGADGRFVKLYKDRHSTGIRTSWH